MGWSSYWIIQAHSPFICLYLLVCPYWLIQLIWVKHVQLVEVWLVFPSAFISPWDWTQTTHKGARRPTFKMLWGHRQTPSLLLSLRQPSLRHHRSATLLLQMYPEKKSVLKLLLLMSCPPPFSGEKEKKKKSPVGLESTVSLPWKFTVFSFLALETTCPCFSTRVPIKEHHSSTSGPWAQPWYSQEAVKRLHFPASSHGFKISPWVKQESSHLKFQFSSFFPFFNTVNLFSIHHSNVSSWPSELSQSGHSGI